MTDNCIITCSGACVISGGVCYASSIPALCNGAIASGNCSQITVDSAGVVYTAGSAIYNIGRLRAILPGYNPNNSALGAYNFTNQDLSYIWNPAIYHMSGGAVVSITSGGVISSGVVQTVCEDNYNVAAQNYSIISWYEPAEALAGI